MVLLELQGRRAGEPHAAPPCNYTLTVNEKLFRCVLPKGHSGDHTLKIVFPKSPRQEPPEIPIGCNKP